MGIRAAMSISLGVAISAITLALVNVYAFKSALPPEVFAIYFALALLYVGASRFGARELLRIRPSSVQRVIIYGSGAAGAQLCASLIGSSQFKPIALVDDSVKVQGARVRWLSRSLAGDAAESAPQVWRRTHSSRACRAPTRRRRGQIIETLSAQGFKVQTFLISARSFRPGTTR
jgi:FlaA1/EpsC-like NDP-sugar epimerase